MTVRMTDEIGMFLDNPKAVLQQVDAFRRNVETSLQQTIQDVENGIEYSLVRTSKEPSPHILLSPELADLDPDRFLISASIALFEYADPSADKRLFTELKSTEEGEIGNVAEGLYNGLKGGQYEWSMKYEKQDNSILFNELPSSYLGSPTNVPNILYYLWNGINTGVNANVGRNYGLTEQDIAVKVAHEMTHAFLYVESRGASLKNQRNSIVDEAAAMTTSYILTGGWESVSGYEDAGLNTKQLDNVRKIMVEKLPQDASKKQKVSELRKLALDQIH